MSIGTHNPEPAIDVIHGLTILDPYRWLEDRASSETQEWLDSQKRVHDEYFSKLAHVDRVRSRVSEYLDMEVIEQPTKVGNRLFFRRRKKRQEQACIYVQEIDTGAERVLVDPSDQGRFVAVAIRRISENGGLLAFALKHGGEQTEELHFVDVDNGRILEDHLGAGYIRGLAIGPDNAGFYYCHETGESDIRDSPHEIRYRSFGDPCGADTPLISLRRTDQSRLMLVSDNLNLGAVFVHERSSELRMDLFLAPFSQNTQWHLIFADKTLPYGPFLHHGGIYVLTFAGTPHGRIVELLKNGSEGSLIVPEWKVPIGSFRTAEDSLYVSYLVDCSTVIHRWSWTGEFLEELPPHPEGSFGVFQASASNSDALFFMHESFCEPQAILTLSESTHSYVPWPTQLVALKEHNYQIQRVSYSSKDGTLIPMWLVALNSGQSDRCRPAILTGYGGFGISMTPRFSVLVAIMVELGCVFALPGLRGGSEFGKGWHEAARKRNRQVAYDDFLAAADWLCANRITRPDQLAIFGGSNSGLLVAAAMTQRPELFQAVLCMAPVLDMLRYEHFGDARKWRDEFGSVSDEEDFRALYAYSPYHRVEAEIDYPAILFVTGDKDTECDPSHVRKMAARLQDRTTQHHPVLVDYSAERGHVPDLPLSVRIDALSRRIAFLCNELGIDVPTEEVQ
jgi:prolyl oligopeptidase